MNRRTLLKSAGLLSIVVGAGGVWRGYQQGVCSAGEGPAYTPWHDWRSATDDGVLSLVRAAILAASPHNTQPWLFRVGPERIELYAAMARNLGSMDPYRREMHIGLGCAVENMCLAATASQFALELQLPAGNLATPGAHSGFQLAAALQLTRARSETDPLYSEIGLRHTNRGPYDLARGIAAADLATLQQLGRGDPTLKLFLFAEPAQRDAFGELVVNATQAIIDDPQMVEDSARWFRYDWDAVQRLRDGPTLDTAGLPPVLTALAKLLPEPSASSSHRYWLEATRDVHVATAAGFGLIAVRDLYDRPQTLRAGRYWQRLHLWANARGIAMQPLNQPLELVDRQRQLGLPPSAARRLAELTGEAGWQPTFAFRLGYPQRTAPPSPRRDLAMVLL